MYEFPYICISNSRLIGGTIHKDFKYDIHLLLFSYPFKKGHILGKFVAGYIVTLSVLLSTTLGMILGTFLPGVNPDLIAPFSISPYLQSFWIYLIPNVFFWCYFICSSYIQPKYVVGFLFWPPHNSRNC